MQTSINRFLCNTCVHRGFTNTGEPACILHKKLINLQEDFCSDHFNSSEGAIPCSLCKQNVKIRDIIVHINSDNEIQCFCADCYSKLYTCETCRYANECGFASDHSMPQMVMQNIQNGFMTMQTQVKNPKLVEKHCISCRCSCDNKGTCLRERSNEKLCTHWAAR